MGRVFVIGDINVDVFCRAGGIPEPGEETHMEEVNYSLGGNAANFAFSLGRLGLKPELFAATGNDFAGRFLESELKKSGVRASIFKSQKPSGISLVFLRENGDRSFLSNKGAAGDLDLAKVEKPVLERAGKDDIIYIGGIFHLRKMQKGLAGFLKRVNARGAAVMLDFCYDEYGLWVKAAKPLLPLIDLAFMDRLELEKLSGEKDVEKGLRKLEAAGLKKIILKLGSEGSAFYSGGRLTEQKACKVRCVNSTGAGDVFNAGFVFGWLQGLGPKACLQLGNSMACFKIQRDGIELPEIKEMNKILRRLKR